MASASGSARWIGRTDVSAQPASVPRSWRGTWPSSRRREHQRVEPRLREVAARQPAALVVEEAQVEGRVVGDQHVLAGEVDERRERVLDVRALGDHRVVDPRELGHDRGIGRFGRASRTGRRRPQRGPARRRSRSPSRPGRRSSRGPPRRRWPTRAQPTTSRAAPAPPGPPEPRETARRPRRSRRPAGAGGARAAARPQGWAATWPTSSGPARRAISAQRRSGSESAPSAPGWARAAAGGAGWREAPSSDSNADLRRHPGAATSSEASGSDRSS